MPAIEWRCSAKRGEKQMRIVRRPITSTKRNNHKQVLVWTVWATYQHYRKKNPPWLWVHYFVCKTKSLPLGSYFPLSSTSTIKLSWHPWHPHFCSTTTKTKSLIVSYFVFWAFVETKVILFCEIVERRWWMQPGVIQVSGRLNSPICLETGMLIPCF